MRLMPVSSKSLPSSWSAPPVHHEARTSVGLPARAGLALIRAYKLLVSPWFAGACRFVPSCSDYTSEAIARFGLARGMWLGVRRLSRCHPLGGHGLDPVPAARQTSTHATADRTSCSHVV